MKKISRTAECTCRTMEDSDSGEDIFLTQNTFNKEASDSTTDGSPRCQSTSSYIDDLMLEDISSDDDILCTALDEAEAEVAATLPSTSSTKAETLRLGTIVTEEDIKKRGVRRLAANTEKKISWAVNLFATWKRQRNELHAFDPSISYIHPSLEEMTKDELNFSISRFLCEVKKLNGDDYPAQTLYELVIQFQLFLEQKGKMYKLISDDTFVQIRNTLDYIMKERTSAGIGTSKKKAEIITEGEEDDMWTKGVLGMETPKRLIDTLVYLIGLNFAFRAGLEHRNLRWANPQLTIVSSGDGGEALRYAEDVSKTNQGGLASRKIKQKVVFAFPNKDKPDRCLLRYFKAYIAKCPPAEKRPADSFYLRPLPAARGPEDIWFACAPLGVNQLRGTVARLCMEAGLKGFRTNHSLRATAATRLYQAGLDEQLVCEITGHRSETVREYKRTDLNMKRHSSAVINATAQTSGEQDDRKRICLEQHPTPLNITINLNMKPQ